MAVFQTFFEYLVVRKLFLDYELSALELRLKGEKKKRRRRRPTHNNTTSTKLWWSFLGRASKLLTMVCSLLVLSFLFFGGGVRTSLNGMKLCAAKERWQKVDWSKEGDKVSARVSRGCERKWLRAYLEANWKSKCLTQGLLFSWVYPPPHDADYLLFHLSLVPLFQMKNQDRKERERVIELIGIEDQDQGHRHTDREEEVHTLFCWSHSQMCLTPFLSGKWIQWSRQRSWWFNIWWCWRRWWWYATFRKW